MSPPPAPRGRVLIVENELAEVTVLARLVTLAGHDVRTAPDGESALAAIAQELPDLILLDVQMPGLNGFEVCRIVKRNPATRLTPIILITGLNAREDRIEGINAGADDFLSKPFDTEELRARIHSLVRLKHYTDELDSAESVILSLALTVEARDPYTDGHCHRMAAYSVALGRARHLPDDDLATLRRGGYLHDVGKIGISDAVLLKPGPLTVAEFSLMKQHTIIGERLCGNLRVLKPVRAIVRHHHERLDGSGYPDGLSGDAVPLLAQIVGIADVYDAITTARPYRLAAPPEHAYEELAGEAARGTFDRELVTTFVGLGRSGLLIDEAMKRDSRAGFVL